MYVEELTKSICPERRAKWRVSNTSCCWRLVRRVALLYNAKSMCGRRPAEHIDSDMHACKPSCYLKVRGNAI